MTFYRLALVAMGVATMWSARASAQDLPTVATLATATSEGVDEELGPSFDRVIRSRLDALGGVEVRGDVPLVLEDVQLALSCEGESRSCLTVVARELAVEVLVIPNLDRVGSDLVLTVGIFDVRGARPIHRVARRARGEAAASELLDELDGLLAELFDVPREGDGPEAAPPETSPETSLETSGSSASGPVARGPAGPDGGRLGVALAVGGLGLATLGVAVGLGVAAQDGADTYASATFGSEGDADRALALYRNASEQATLANGLFVGGGLVLAAGLAWAVVELATPGGSTGDQASSVVPFASPTGAGLAWRGELP